MARSTLTRTQVLRNIEFTRKRKLVSSLVREMRMESEKENPRRDYSIVKVQRANPTVKLRKDKSGNFYDQPRNERGQVLGARKILIPAK